MPHNPHDLLFRAVFSRPAEAAALLAGALPPALAGAIDWTSLVALDGSSVDEDLAERHADLLYEARFATGQRALLYVLFEHQRTPDPLMPLRLLRYAVRTWDRWLHAHPNAHRLPPLVPVVLYHGATPWTVPATLYELLAAPPELALELRPLVPSLGYLLEDLSHHPDEALHGAALGRMALLLLKHCESGDLWERLPGWIETLHGVLDAGGLRAVEMVLRYIVEVDRGPPSRGLLALLARDLGPKVEEAVMGWAQQLRDEGRQEGRQEGRREGRQEGRQEGRLGERQDLLLRLLAHRFGEVPEPVLQRVRAADADQLLAWTDRLLDAASAEEVVGS